MSKVISGEASDACRPWRLPVVDEGGAEGAGGLLTANRLEEIHNQAYQEGFELGRREGLEKGQAQARAQTEQLARILETFARPLARLDEELVEELSTLALTIARHIIRREIKLDPGQIVGVVRQAVSLLPLAARPLRVFLNPEDAALLREHLHVSEHGQQDWQIVEEPTLARGGCRVETDTARIDASVERRLAAIAAEMLGGEREGDDGGA